MQYHAQRYGRTVREAIGRVWTDKPIMKEEEKFFLRPCLINTYR